MPKWWNWQTRQTQNLVVAIPCGFKSHYPYHVDVVQWLEPQSSKLIMWVQFPSSTPNIGKCSKVASWSPKPTEVGSIPYCLCQKNAACLGGEEVVLKTIDRLFGLQVRILCAAPCGCSITVSTLPCQGNSLGSIPFIHSKKIGF